jgi:ribonuclease HI
MSVHDKLTIYSDGGARGNPGPGGIGAVIYDKDGHKLAEISEFIGKCTNNQSEYRAILAAIKKAKEFKAEQLDCYLDSELVVKQLKGEYKVKNTELAPLFVKVYNETLNFQKVNFHHIPREKNKEADKLANQAMDRAATAK